MSGGSNVIKQGTLRHVGLGGGGNMGGLCFIVQTERAQLNPASCFLKLAD